MSSAQQCPACGSSLPLDAPAGFCVECLMRLAEDPSSFQAVYDTEVPGKDSGPARFGDYELLRQIGRGGMGVVYEARQVRLNRTVALKMILDSGLASASAVRRFKIEAETAAKLDHPNIVAIHEFGECEGLPFLVMQRIEGRSLDREMSSISLPNAVGNAGGAKANKAAVRPAEERIAKLIAALARALECAHERGIIHCDVKPSNVLIDPAGQPHLTDFGIARILDLDGRLTKSGMMGTPRYMSPEQASGRRDQITFATDVYGLGVIFYELLTGRPPFRGPTPHETLRRVIEREPAAPHEVYPLVHRDLSVVCLKCLEKNARHRYGSAAALADDLERWLRREPIHARRANLPKRLVRWCQRKPVMAGLTASIGLLLATIAIISTLFAWRMSRNEQQQEAARQAVNRDVMDRLDELWENPEKAALKILSDQRRMLNNKPLLIGADSGAIRRVHFGVYSFLKPTEMLKQFSPILDNLEKVMSERLREPVAIDFTIYRTYILGHDALLSGQVDFMRVGPASYVLLKGQQPGISLLVAQDNFIQCAIFTLKESKIESLSELKGTAFAFGDAESTYGSFMAKHALARAGLRAGDLSAHSRHFSSHSEVVEVVRSGDYAAGSANVVAIDTNTFKELHRFSNELRMPFVARSGLELPIAQALKEAFLAQKSPEVLTIIAPRLKGLRQVSDHDYNALREKMKEAEAFGGISQ